MTRARFYDLVAVAAMVCGDTVEAPFRRLERWAYRRWYCARSTPGMGRSPLPGHDRRGGVGGGDARRRPDRYAKTGIILRPDDVVLPPFELPGAPPGVCYCGSPWDEQGHPYGTGFYCSGRLPA